MGALDCPLWAEHVAAPASLSCARHQGRTAGVGLKRPYGVFCQTKNTLGFSAVAQEPQISAIDQRRRVLDERDDGGAQGDVFQGSADTRRSP